MEASTLRAIVDCMYAHIPTSIYVPDSNSGLRGHRRLIAAPFLWLPQGFPSFFVRCYRHLQLTRVFWIRHTGSGMAPPCHGCWISTLLVADLPIVASGIPAPWERLLSTSTCDIAVGVLSFTSQLPMVTVARSGPSSIFHPFGRNRDRIVEPHFLSMDQWFKPPREL